MGSLGVDCHLDAGGAQPLVQPSLDDAEQVLLCGPAVRGHAAVEPARRAVGGFLEPARVQGRGQQAAETVGGSRLEAALLWDACPCPGCMSHVTAPLSSS